MWRNAGTKNGAGRARGAQLRRVMLAGLSVLLIATGAVTTDLATAPVPATAAPDLEAPLVYKTQAFYDRIDGDVDELRSDFVLKVPHGLVNPKTGELQSVNGQQLRIGYDYHPKIQCSMTYKNTMGSKAGADAWAANHEQAFTIHSVLKSGKSDFLVVSVQGDMDIDNTGAGTNIPGGLSTPMNWYFSYGSGAPSSSSTWIKSARTVESVNYFTYWGGRSMDVATGPQLRVQWDHKYELWSGKQANWGQVLDYGLSSSPAGVLPPNSIAIDLVNNGTKGLDPEKGYRGTVSDSFWYAWVHEDGSLVQSINTAPIRITGVKPRESRTSETKYVSKNIAQSASKYAPALGWTVGQANQGLTDRTGVDGSVDFRDAGGTGYYRLLAWPEARDPLTPSGDKGAPRISYSPSDLFDASGMITPAADAAKWTPGSAYFKYRIAVPDAPAITVPTEGYRTNNGTTGVISGTGTPGHTISLKLKPAAKITDYRDPTLELLVDGDHKGVQPGDVVVDAHGNWSFTYTPTTALVTGTYTVVAVQTDQTAGSFNLTSGMSNPNDPANAADWGVTFYIDTTAPVAPKLTCLISPLTETSPTLTGTGVETGARVYVSIDGKRVGEATVTGTSWSYTVDQPLRNGKYTFTATQVDAAGNESPASNPPCTVQVTTPLDATGIKIVVPVQNGAPGLADPTPENWEIVLSDGVTTTVLSPTSGTKIKRDTTYTVEERVRTSPAPDERAARYTQLGDITCLDANAGNLPAGSVDPVAGTVRIAGDANIAEPISCRITNQAAQLSLVTKRIGGQTTVPPAGWGIDLTADQAGDNASIGEAAPSAVVRPGGGKLAAVLPSGVLLIGYEILNQKRPECAALASAPTTIPETCWEALPAGAAPAVSVAQGTHAVVRMTAGSRADVPPLPMTGGLGSDAFTLGGLGGLLLAGVLVVRRRILLTQAAAA